MHATPGSVGQWVFVIAKIWLLVFPALWYLVVERGRVSWSPPRHGGLGVGMVLGLVMSAVILGAYWGGLSRLIDPIMLRHTVVDLELDSPRVYLAGALYWIFINSVIEEYVYRWFVLRQARALVTDWLAILGSALVFTIHHTVAMADYLGAAPNALGSIGVFVAGGCWSWLYLRYRSIWVPWIAHAFADVAIFLIGWQIIFG
jgi:membrane protease YdiL (CAAX protease family)